jgi:hypothetical protein
MRTLNYVDRKRVCIYIEGIWLFTNIFKLDNCIQRAILSYPYSEDCQIQHFHNTIFDISIKRNVYQKLRSNLHGSKPSC